MKKFLLATLLSLAALWLLGALVPGREMTFRSEVEVELPVTQVWSLMQDLSLAHHYVPGLTHVKITTTQATGVGASRRVYSSEESYMVETVSQWHEGQGFTIDLLSPDGGPAMPFASAQFDYLLAPADPDSQVTLQLRCTLPGGIVGEWLGRLLLGGVFQQQIDDVAAGLKRFYEGQRSQPG